MPQALSEFQRPALVKVPADLIDGHKTVFRYSVKKWLRYVGLKQIASRPLLYERLEACRSAEHGRSGSLAAIERVDIAKVNLSLASEARARKRERTAVEKRHAMPRRRQFQCNKTAGQTSSQNRCFHMSPNVNA